MYNGNRGLSTRSRSRTPDRKSGKPDCSGSNRHGDIRTWPGDSDRCVDCGKWMKVKQDGTIGRHVARAKGWNGGL